MQSQQSQIINKIADFEIWLFVRLAPLLLGNKTGQLLIIRACLIGLEVPVMVEVINRLSDTWKISYFVFCQCEKRIRILFYDRGRANRMLVSIPDKYLSKCGFVGGKTLTVEGFLAEIARKWVKNGSIPHEIGFILGYPVKDVLGFMGIVDLPHSGYCGWKIYGDKKTSLRLKKKYDLAKKKAIQLVQRGKT